MSTGSWAHQSTLVYSRVFLEGFSAPKVFSEGKSYTNRGESVLILFKCHMSQDNPSCLCH